MEHKKTMLDYIADCPEFIRNNVADSAALTKPLVDEYVNGGYKNIWIVACGSSSNGSLCARQFIRRHLKCEVKIVTPFNFVSSENDFGETDMVVVVSQSGYSLNALDAIKVIEAKGRRCIGLTGDVNSDLGKVCDVVANYGVGRETVAYVTRGVTTLALFFMLFAVEAAVRLGIKTAAEGEAVKQQLLKAADINAAVHHLAALIGIHELEGGVVGAGAQDQLGLFGIAAVLVIGVLFTAGHQGQGHDHGQQKSKKLFHFYLSFPFFLVLYSPVQGM